MKLSLISKLAGLLLLPALLSCSSDSSDPATTPPATVDGLSIRTVRENLGVPWEISWGPDNVIWMTERSGRVSRINPQNGEQQVVLTLTDVYQQGEAGLLGMALHPDFATEPLVYLVYTYSGNQGPREQLVRYRYNGATLEGRQVLLDNIAANTFHNGSRLLISPDRHLFMTTGDAGNTSLAQNRSSLSGKILRLNLDGSIPADNPVATSYVYSFGHRNAQGLVWHPNGRLYSSEHGPNSDDEINSIAPGGNYGWPTVLGTADSPAEQTFAQQNQVTGSILQWTPTIAPSDLIYYTNSAIPLFQNKLVMTVLKDQSLIAITLNANGTAVDKQEVFFKNQLGRLRDICVAPDGRIFLATNGSSYPGSTGSLIELKQAP